MFLVSLILSKAMSKIEIIVKLMHVIQTLLVILELAF